MARTIGSKDKQQRTRAKKHDAKKRISLRLTGSLLDALKEAAKSGQIYSVSNFIEIATEGAAKASKIYNQKNN